ncbi:glycosyltransferase [Hymenobacter fodinae]|uniref:Glycosyltransferase n=1 Tax=Hymenobacter fodinae TaxID=2510796 RepID=A0A4Z0P0N3_9BACT|nr:glycosyltransferase [Hymenobacter fodinae]TGE04307.1 glycosyltransferase [Hymenobacter fodinae]
MKYLHVISRMDPQLGGVSQAVRTMVNGLASIGAYSEIVSLDAPDAEFLGTDPLPIHALGPAQGPWQYSPHLIPWLVAQLARFDVVILHGLWLYHGYAVRKALTRCRKAGVGALPQLFIMPHGMLDPYFQRAGGRRLKAARNWAYWKLVEAALVNESAGVLFTCEAERQLARQPFRPYHPARELVVGLGVEEPPHYTPALDTAFQQACPTELPDQPYLLFLSRIDPKKGVDLLVDAFVKVAAHVPTSSVLAATSAEPTAVEEPAAPHLVIAGPGLATAYGQSISRASQAQATPARTISLTGMLTGDAKWGAFYGCEAFVLPSHQENFGIAVVEALACGKPVLISDQVNIWQEIEASGAGLVAPDTQAGTEALLTAWYQLSESQKQAMCTRARACYESQFAVSAAAQRLDISLQKALLSVKH